MNIINNFYIINYINIDNHTNKYKNNYNITTKFNWCNGSFLISNINNNYCHKILIVTYSTVLKCAVWRNFYVKK